MTTVPPEVIPVSTLPPSPLVFEPVAERAAAEPATTPSPVHEPLFTIQVWQLGLVVFMLLLAALYVLGIL